MKTYLMNNTEYDFVTGTLPDGKQAIAGILFPDLPTPSLTVSTEDGDLLFSEGKQETTESPVPKLTMAIFSKTGDFIKLKETGTDIEITDIDGILAATDLRPTGIKVKQFYSADKSIGIKDMPDTYVRFMENPDAEEFDENDREYYPEDIETWKTSNLYLFHWGKDYWIDGNTGNIDST